MDPLDTLTDFGRANDLIDTLIELPHPLVDFSHQLQKRGRELTAKVRQTVASVVDDLGDHAASTDDRQAKSDAAIHKNAPHLADERGSVVAASRPHKQLTSATESNGISITMPCWDKQAGTMAASYPAVPWNKFQIDIPTTSFALKPQLFDVVVASNFFGDILSDLSPACA